WSVTGVQTCALPISRFSSSAKVGPRLFTMAEELNLAVPRLRSHWQESRPPGAPSKSPAFTGLAETAFAGRQVRMHLVLIGQALKIGRAACRERVEGG